MWVLFIQWRERTLCRSYWGNQHRTCQGPSEHVHWSDANHRKMLHAVSAGMEGGKMSESFKINLADFYHSVPFWHALLYKNLIWQLFNLGLMFEKTAWSLLIKVTATVWLDLTPTYFCGIYHTATQKMWEQAERKSKHPVSRSSQGHL